MNSVAQRTVRDSVNALSPSVFWGSMLFALLFPTLLTAVYFVLLADLPSGVQQAVYGVGKCIQFGFPLLFAVLVFRSSRRWGWFQSSGNVGGLIAYASLKMRRKRRWQWLRVDGVGVGLAFGACVLVAMLLLYAFWLKSSGYLTGLEHQVIDKVEDLALDSLWKYVATGVFYSLAHSLLEEYYWRWFVFGHLRPRLGVSTAILISSLGFMAHHIVLLGTFFGWNSPLTYLFSAGVAVGGAVWAWIYSWSHSLLGPWLSHMLIDAAIFIIGFDLVRDVVVS